MCLVPCTFSEVASAERGFGGHTHTHTRTHTQTRAHTHTHTHTQACRSLRVFWCAFWTRCSRERQWHCARLWSKSHRPCQQHQHRSVFVLCFLNLVLQAIHAWRFARLVTLLRQRVGLGTHTHTHTHTHRFLGKPPDLPNNNVPPNV